MIVDSSVLVSIVLGEPDAERWSSVMIEAPNLRVSAATVVEASIVVESRCGRTAHQMLVELLDAVGVDIDPVTPHQAELAVEAWRRFGKGRHPAALNFGDCFSYALSRSTGEPLLFKGDDFTLTDIASAR